MHHSVMGNGDAATFRKGSEMPQSSGFWALYGHKLDLLIARDGTELEEWMARRADDKNALYCGWRGIVDVHRCHPNMDGIDTLQLRICMEM